jgi:hypothetical protein
LIDNAENLAHGISEYREGRFEDSRLQCGERGQPVESLQCREDNLAGKSVQDKNFQACSSLVNIRPERGQTVENFCVSSPKSGGDLMMTQTRTNLELRPF